MSDTVLLDPDQQLLASFASVDPSTVSVLDIMSRTVFNAVAPIHELTEALASPFLDFLKELFAKLLPLLITCLPLAARNAAGVAGAMNRPTARQKIQLKWQIRHDHDDPRTGNMSVNEIFDASIRMGAAMTEAHTTRLMAEVA